SSAPPSPSSPVSEPVSELLSPSVEVVSSPSSLSVQAPTPKARTGRRRAAARRRRVVVTVVSLSVGAGRVVVPVGLRGPRPERARRRATRRGGTAGRPDRGGGRRRATGARRAAPAG